MKVLFKDFLQSLKLNKASGKGFTLVELLVVIAILGILASMAMPAYLKYQAKAKITAYAEPLARACLMDIVTYCMDHPGVTITNDTVGNLTNCKRMVGVAEKTPEGVTAVILTTNSSQSNVYSEPVSTAIYIRGGAGKKTITIYEVRVKNLECDAKGRLIDTNGTSADVTTTVVFDNGDNTNYAEPIGGYYSECSFNATRGIKCTVTDQPEDY